jgi:hypothetical protein
VARSAAKWAICETTAMDGSLAAVIAEAAAVLGRAGARSGYGHGTAGPARERLRASFRFLTWRHDGAGGRQRGHDRVRGYGAGAAGGAAARLSRFRSALAAPGARAGRGRVPGHRPGPARLRRLGQTRGRGGLLPCRAGRGRHGGPRRPRHRPRSCGGARLGRRPRLGAGVARARRGRPPGRAVGRTPGHLPPHGAAAREVVVHAAVPVPWHRRALAERRRLGQLP